DGKDTLTNTTIATFKSAKTVVAKKVTVDKLKTEEGGTTSTTIYDATTNDGVLLNVSGGWDYTPDTQNESNGSTINVKFDTPVDKSTINSKSIQLIDVTTGKNIAVEGNQVNYTDALIIKVVGSKDYLTPKHQYKLLLDGLKAANGMDIDTFSVTFAYQAGKPASVGAAETSIYNGDLKDIKNAIGVDKLVNPLTTSKMLDDGKTFKAAAAVIVDFGAANIKLDESTVTTDYLFIREKDTQKRVAQTISYNKELNRVTLTPSERLKDDTDYEIFESPYIKNIYGVTLGTKDSEYATYPFKTLDVTAPTVVGQPESTLENKSLSKLPIDTVTKINIKMSENIGAISPTTAAKAFATGTGNVLVTRADDEEKSVTVSNDLAKNGIITVKKEVIGRDTYIQLTVDPTKVPKNVEENGNITLEDNPTKKGSYIKDNIKGKTFRVTLAGTNPTRTNDSKKVITDAYNIKGAENAMANDYSITFTFEGEDKTAPKITDIKASNGGDLESINGMTNVDLSKPVRVYFDCTDVDGSADNIKNIKLVDKDNKEYYAEVSKNSGKIETTGNTSYVDVKFKASNDTEASTVKGAFTLKAQDIADENDNKSSLQTYNFIAGTGLKVNTAEFAIPSGSTSEDSYVKITFDKPEDVDVTTLAGNITLKNGDKEIPATIDSSKLTDAKEGNCIKVIPTEKLAGNTTYTLVVGKNVKNNDGNLLQQNGSDAAPADYKINITTDDDAKPAIVGEPTYKDGKLTITFNTEIKEITTDSLKITDSRNSEPTIDGEAKVNGDNKKIVEITVVDKNLDDENVVKLDKGVQYNVKLEVKANNKGGENKDGAVSTVTTSFVPDKDFTTEQKKDVENSVKAKVYKTGGIAGEYGSTADSLVEGSIGDIDAKFTVEFDQNVSVDAVKAMKFKDPATGTEYSTDVKVLDEGDEGYNKDTTKYAKKFAIDISGMFDKAIEFKATLAKGTSVGDDAEGTKVSKTDKDINFVIKLIPNAGE
ncbi:MAG: Ig-like domain-containing protein, partial [Lachnospiraceae bacterium]|nr:Ig-like domain-containing protein [Lachnospiraceae bacterium]